MTDGRTNVVAMTIYTTHTDRGQWIWTRHDLHAQTIADALRQLPRTRYTTINVTHNNVTIYAENNNNE